MQSSRDYDSNAVEEKLKTVEESLASQPLFRYDDWAFYLGLGIVGTLGFIDWPVVTVMVAGHALSRRVHNRALSEALEGVESGV